MAHSVEMPELGESVTEGTITQWLKSVGDTVEVDEPLLEVSTDKVDTEIPAPVAGTLLKILAEEDDTVDVGAVIAEIGDSDEAPSGDDADDSGSSDSDNAADAGSSDSDEASDDDGADSSASDDSSDDAAASDDSGSAAPSGSGDATDVTMPELGESVSEGTITQWLKSVGDTVAVDEPLLEVSTDKVDTEVPSPVEGTLLEILAQEDDTVDVGAVIARVGDASAAPSGGDSAGTDGKDEDTAEKAEEKAPEKAEEKSEDTSEKKAPEAPAASSSSSQSSAGTEPGEGSLPYVTPLVRKLAEKHKVDLSKVTGSGVGGRIRKQDVLAAAEDTTPATGAAGAGSPAGSRASTKSVDRAKAELRGTTRKVNRIRAITAKTTLTSLHSAAQLTQVHEVDMTHVAELRKARKQAFRDAHGVNLTYLPFFAKAIVEALVSHPNINASYNAETQEMTYHDKVNLGIAVDTPEGLLSPVIHDAQDMSLPELAKAIVDLADRARNKKLKPNDIAGGTFTITNIGSEGALTDTPILVPPQAAMIGTGAIVKRPVVISEDDSDSIAIRQMVLLPMTYDHQVIDGADAGRFLTTVRDRLETADFEDDLGL
ncbi:2-oxoglutarate dehydrogenase, E2 component, dihydrolipoamide succinyltransferase [Corynebacterium bovis]|uniref:Dihydrolipoamide acetyltransferase component of pyruvate dehydrogenase complex n=1 Tax=Corynebacterium bovis DSM 20582 = CIP 54.80 TaxID=927655 RepID=A0A8H9Y617_9CORY|nr:2-oxoglutarate dehydrogenase, E2 component, dihydrolipoamide succinyltransferase [Corynebacterium bovis]MBB3115008.1 2-oxoglutarate dehydrogenase E2 component (dihydrolipoamide succinyltransferase) [Corynebacterium bovis DSM 20582 = CIP 54.80]QQC48006.1 2-oxoglutarate dehydrogenase, E2 component, dihydrolipoamide succinyltransferase [Corynebacterium bovis]WJY77882.1 Dihydrolipoyllysine-residue acetyltransferase component of pyruvate dehydrogenase complex [Corynebacterium bovis DSM 20582 = CIP